MTTRPPLYLLPVQRSLRGRFAAIAVCVVIAVAAELWLGQFVRAIIDTGLTAESMPRLQQQFLGLLVLISGLTVATWLRFRWINTLSEKIVAKIREDLFERLLGLDAAFFDRHKVSDLVARVTTDTALIQTALGLTMSMALRNVLLIVGAMILLVMTSGRLALIAFVIVALTLLPIIFLARRVRRFSTASQAGIADVSDFAGERLEQIATVQTFTAERREREEFGRRVDQAMQQGIRRGQVQSVLAALATGLIFAAIALVMGIGARDVIAERITAGELVAFLIYAIFAASAVGNLSEVWSQWQRAAGAWERCEELFDAVPGIVAPAVPRPIIGGKPPEIVFDQVAFSYPSRPTERILDGFSLDIPGGATLALVGPSGGGKSTLFRLIARLYDVQDGRVCVDGVDVRDVDPTDLRRRLAIVPQEPALFAGSIRENITYGNPHATEAQVREAAVAAASWEFITELPEGLETRIGSRGGLLSGGQRQRLAIARAILSGAELLLFDEATSALDSENERLVQQAMKNIAVNRTVLIIAHRLSTVQWADQIAVIDRGGCAAVGRHDELLAVSPLYQRLVQSQWLGAAENNPPEAGPSERIEVSGERELPSVSHSRH